MTENEQFQESGGGAEFFVHLRNRKVNLKKILKHYFDKELPSESVMSLQIHDEHGTLIDTKAGVVQIQVVVNDKDITPDEKLPVQETQEDITPDEQLPVQETQEPELPPTVKRQMLRGGQDPCQNCTDVKENLTHPVHPPANGKTATKTPSETFSYGSDFFNQKTSTSSPASSPLSKAFYDHNMGLAIAASLGNKDEKMRVGFYCTDCDGKVLGVAHNTYPPGFKEKKSRKKTSHMIVHAEVAMIILNGSGHLKGSTVFLTNFPCETCAEWLIEEEVAMVCYLVYQDTDTYRKSAERLKAKGVILRPHVESDEEWQLFEKDIVQGLKNVAEKVLEQGKPTKENKIKQDMFKGLQKKTGVQEFSNNIRMALLLFAAIPSCTETSGPEGMVVYTNNPTGIPKISGVWPVLTAKKEDENKKLSTVDSCLLHCRNSGDPEREAYAIHPPLKNDAKRAAMASIVKYHFLSPAKLDPEVKRIYGDKLVPLKFDEKKLKEPIEDAKETFTIWKQRRCPDFTKWPRSPNLE